MTVGAIAIFDSNAVIDLKQSRVGIQWKLLRGLEVLVARGAICVPGQVIREVSDVRHPDAPGVWAKGIEKQQRHQVEPDPAYVKWVMSGQGADLPIWDTGRPSGGVPEVLDQQADTEQADPYVVALALQFKTEGRDCIVVTRDTRDRLGKISPARACRLLGIPTTTIEDYLESIQDGIDPTCAGKAASDIRKWNSRRSE